MIRDADAYQKWHDWHRDNALLEFEKKKAKAFEDANNAENEQARKAMLFKANKMTFQFDKSGLISYGNCSKLKKPVAFIPNVCQVETQFCWEGR